MALNSHLHSLVYLLAMVAMFGRPLIGSAQTQDYNAGQARIDSLLTLHDECLKTDKAINIALEALRLASDCFGFESEEAAAIYADYLLNDLSKFKEVIVTDVYSSTPQLFEPSAPFSWRPLLRLGEILESYNETPKALTLYELIVSTSPSPQGRIYAGMALAGIRHREEGAYLEAEYNKLVPEFEKLEMSDQARLLMFVACNLADYFLSIDNEEKALEYITNGERLKGHVSDLLYSQLYQFKYRYFLKYDHQEALKCLLDAMVLIDKDTDSEGENNVSIAYALLSIAEYVWNNFGNPHLCASYLLKAYNLIKNPLSSTYDDIMRQIVFNCVFFCRMAGEYDSAIDLATTYFSARWKGSPPRSHYNILLELIEVYLRKGDIDNAEALFEKYGDEMKAYERTFEKAVIAECGVLAARNNDKEVVRKLEHFLKIAKREDSRIWGERKLASAYARLGDRRLDAVSDSINLTTKRNVSRQFWFISPQQRINWLQLCTEAITHQLSLGGTHTVENAANLNLFRKSLVFRTEKEIGKIISSNPDAAPLIARLDSFRQLHLDAMSRGDSIEARRCYGRIDSIQQAITTRFTDIDGLLTHIDVTVTDVINRLSDGDAVVDFFYNSMRGHTHIGAFVYTNRQAPQYISLVDIDSPLTDKNLKDCMSPLLSLVGCYRNIYLCADGKLNLMPLEYCFADSGYNIHRVFHLSELRPSPVIGSGFAFVGTTNHPEKSSGWAPLSSPDSELRSIIRNFPATELIQLTDSSATKTGVRRLNHSPISTLHISSHGVFKSDNHLSPASLYSLSGLILNDGILTAEEIETLTFPHLNLAVLSACHSALGHADHEGVWGLQRAFRIAGAKNLICTLNEIDDYWIAQFMDTFYQNAARGISIYEAFQEAKQWLKSELPDNPEIWSAIILIE